jgi:hypothetical protein
MSLELVPLGTQHYPSLFRLETRPDCHHAFRLLGSTPRPEAYVDSLWAGVHAHYVIVDRGSPEVLGALAFYNVNPTNQFGFASIIVDEARLAPGRAMIFMARFVDAMFRSVSVRKIMFEASSATVNQFHSGVARGLLQENARIADHVFVDGSFVDYFLLSIDRDRFYESSIFKRYVT